MTRKAEKNVKTVALEVDGVKQALMEQKDFLVPIVASGCSGGSRLSEPVSISFPSEL